MNGNTFHYMIAVTRTWAIFARLFIAHYLFRLYKWVQPELAVTKSQHSCCEVYDQHEPDEEIEGIAVLWIPTRLVLVTPCEECGVGC